MTALCSGKICTIFPEKGALNFWKACTIALEYSDKITTEKKYHLDGIYSAINNTFLTVGLPRIEDGSGALVYRDCGRAKDFSLFGKIVNTLKKQTWFMDNVAVWRLYDSDDSDSPEDFNEEDLLTHYREKQAMRA